MIQPMWQMLPDIHNRGLCTHKTPGKLHPYNQLHGVNLGPRRGPPVDPMKLAIWIYTSRQISGTICSLPADYLQKLHDPRYLSLIVTHATLYKQMIYWDFILTKIVGGDSYIPIQCWVDYSVVGPPCTRPHAAAHATTTGCQCYHRLHMLPPPAVNATTSCTCYHHQLAMLPPAAHATSSCIHCHLPVVNATTTSCTCYYQQLPPSCCTCYHQQHMLPLFNSICITSFTCYHQILMPPAAKYATNSCTCYHHQMQMLPPAAHATITNCTCHQQLNMLPIAAHATTTSCKYYHQLHMLPTAHATSSWICYHHSHPSWTCYHTMTPSHLQMQPPLPSL